MLWLLIPLLTFAVYFFLFRKPTPPPADTQREVKQQPRKLFSEKATKLKKSLGLEETNKPICISLRKHDINASKAALLRIIQELGELADIYLVFHAPSDEHEKEIHAELQLCLVGFPLHRCLFHSTDVGKVAIVRQVIPSLLIEYDRPFCDKLKPHLKRIIWVDNSAAGCASTTTQSCNPHLQGSGTAVTLPDKCGAVEGATNSQVSHASVAFPTVNSLVDVLHISLP